MRPARGSVALGTLLLLFTLGASAEPPAEPHDCGLEPPGAVYVPAPGPRPYEQRWGPTAPPPVRRERPPGALRALSGVPHTRERTGALSGKTVYLSAGHGFFRSSSARRWATQRDNSNDVVEDLVSIEAVNQYLLPMLMGAGARVVPVREPDFNARMVILNNGDPGYTEEGPAGLFSRSLLPGWGGPAVPLSTREEPFLLGGSRRMQVESATTARAVWAPTLPEDGDYHVYVAYAAHPEHVPDAHYVVRHAGGESHFRVDQRRHGGTWVLLGRFHFRAGYHPESASVVALNDSSAGGGSVSLDAVRFGGGSGAIGDSAMAPLARPRYEECARYHTQFSGAPASVYAASGTNGLSNERNDDVTSRPRFAAWDHEEGEDAAYVSWHTNAFSTTTVRGTEVYVYGPNPVDGRLVFAGTPGSDELGRTLLEELRADLQRELEPDWRVRPLRSANFAEVNPAHNPEMPAVLLEMAYHSSPEDARWLREPHFRRVAARAILHGLIRYFATKDGRPVRLPPEPPVALVARNTGGGRVEVRWLSPPDPEGSEPALYPATGYRVYQSEDGRAWDEGTEVQEPAFNLTLAEGTVRYFRVASVNAGGESFPSGLVAVRVGDAPALLLVDAFERLDSTLARAEDLSPYGLRSPVRLRLEAMNDGTALRRHGEAAVRNAQAFDSASRQALAAGLASLSGYRVVDWLLGRGSRQGAAPSAAEQQALRAHVSSGGHLLLSGSQVATALAAGSAEEQAFLSEVLGAALDTGLPGQRLRGVAGGWLASLPELALEDGTRGAYPVGTVEALLPVGSAAVLGHAGSGQVAGLASAPGGQVLFLGVPFEGLISAAGRGYVLGAFFHRAGLLAAVPEPPVGDEEPPAVPGPRNYWEPASMADPKPLFLLEALPDVYPAPQGGCGCGAGAESASFTGLLLGLAALVRRARAGGRSGSR